MMMALGDRLGTVTRTRVKKLGKGPIYDTLKKRDELVNPALS